MGVPQNWWFIMDNPIKMDDLGVYTFILGNLHIAHLSVNHHGPGAAMKNHSISFCWNMQKTSEILASSDHRRTETWDLQ